MTTGYFITGTDTGIGKTTVTLALMDHLKKQGNTVVGMKPIASGCEQTPQGLRNDDAVQIQQACSRDTPYALINPYAFQPPIAPHIAAQQAGKVIEIEKIVSAYQQLFQLAEIVIVEGVGGWQVPLGETLQLPDLVKALGLPVIMVVGIRLGCINHALLTASAIQSEGFQLTGWIANHIEKDTLEIQALVQTLQQRIDAPQLAELSYSSKKSVDDMIEFSISDW